MPVSQTLLSDGASPPDRDGEVPAVERIDAAGIHYRLLNEFIRRSVAQGKKEFVLENICGQRYIGAGLEGDITIRIRGVPGNDLGAFMNGPAILVDGNGQDGIANTMNGGLITVNGDAGDVLGYGMRGGRVFVRGRVGYRVGIHMKAFGEHVPAIVIGNTAGDFLGEYMAGGIIVVLGLDRRAGEPLAGRYLGTGMHGGVIYLRGRVEEHGLGREVKVFALDEEDETRLRGLLDEFDRHFGTDLSACRPEEFIKLLPVSHRPYGRLYAT